MTSHYKRIGDYIRLVDERNRNLKTKTLLGLTVNKLFIPSVANTIGTNMANYKIIKYNQFACSLMQVRRDKKIPVAILKEFDQAIISQAYPVFEVKNPQELLPDYLMMWMTRSEFDREACFYAVGGVRGSLEWKDFCNMELPIPSPEKQQEMVNEYNIIVNRINLNNELIIKLEETAQALYKHWFVDFEFPISKEYAQSNGKPELEGKPYKSSGGEMIYDEQLDQEIPRIGQSAKINDLGEIIDGDRGSNYPKKHDFFNKEYCLFLNAGNVTKEGFNFSNTSFITKEQDRLLRKGKLFRFDTVLTTRGTVGNLGFFGKGIEFENIRINSGMVIIRPLSPETHSHFLYSLMRSSYMTTAITNQISGSAQPQLPIRDILKIPVFMPPKQNIKRFNQISGVIQTSIDFIKYENRKLSDLKDILLSALAKTEYS